MDRFDTTSGWMGLMTVVSSEAAPRDLNWLRRRDVSAAMYISAAKVQLTRAVYYNVLHTCMYLLLLSGERVAGIVWLNDVCSTAGKCASH